MKLLNKYGYYLTDENDKVFTKMDISGFDADLFLKEFVDFFEVDMSSFHYECYFNNECIIPFAYLIMKKPPKDCSFKHLLNIVESKKWVDEN